MAFMAFMCQHKISALRLIPSSNQSQALTMLYSFWLSISLTSSLFRSFAFAAKCYYPDGSPVLENDFQPCVLISGIDSMCCATNRDSLPDTCLANGLCHNPCKNQDDCSNIPGRYWRESCTDPSWNSPFCLRGVCASSNEIGSNQTNVPLSQCAIDGHWCCGDLSSEACCAMDSRFSLAANVGASSSTSSTLLRSTSSTANQESNLQPTSSLGPTSISSSIPTSTSTSAASHSQTGKSAGLGAGIGIGVLAIGIIVGWFVRRQRRRRSRENQYQRPVEKGHAMAYGVPKHGSNGTHLAQLENGPMLATPEIDGSNTHEIDGANTHEIDGSSFNGRQDNYIGRNTLVAHNT